MKRISENEAERKRLGSIERKRKTRARTLSILRRVLAVTLCAAMIAGFGLEMIPANAEGESTEPTVESTEQATTKAADPEEKSGVTTEAATTKSAVTTEAAKTTTETAKTTTETATTTTKTTTETTTETAKGKSENEISVVAKCIDTDGNDISGQDTMQIQDAADFAADKDSPVIAGYTFVKAQISQNDTDTVITKIEVSKDA